MIARTPVEPGTPERPSRVTCADLDRWVDGTEVEAGNELKRGWHQ